MPTTEERRLMIEQLLAENITDCQEALNAVLERRGMKLSVALRKEQPAPSLAQLSADISIEFIEEQTPAQGESELPPTEQTEGGRLAEVRQLELQACKVELEGVLAEHSMVMTSVVTLEDAEDGVFVRGSWMLKPIVI